MAPSGKKAAASGPQVADKWQPVDYLRIANAASWIHDARSKILGSSFLEDPGSDILDLNPRILGPGNA